MNSSGFKRGLAVSAIGAMAVAGVALSPSPASAQTIGQGVTAGSVQLWTDYYDVSTKTDGTDTTTTLYATVANSLNATYVQFFLNGALVTPVGLPDGKVVVVDGVARAQWQPTAFPAGSTLEARAFNAGGTQVGASSTLGAVFDFENAGNQSVRLGDGPDFTEVGFFDNNGSGTAGGKNIAVRGTTSGTAVNTQVVSPVSGASVPADVDTSGVGVHPWTSVLSVPDGDIVDANTTTGRDQVVVQASNASVNGGADHRTYSLYEQVVQNATLDKAATQQVADDSGATTTWTISVVDQNGKPVAGARVVRINNAVCQYGNGSGNTDANGQFQVNITEGGGGLCGIPDDHSQSYFVDVNGNGGAYQNGIDYRFDLAQDDYTAVPTTAVIDLDNGLVQDDDEAHTGTVTVKDQNGNPVANGTPVQLTYTRERLDTPAGTTTTGPTAVAVAGGNGKATFNIPVINDADENITINAFVNNNGTPVADAGDAIASQVKLISGESAATWDNGTTAQAGNGTTTTQTGKLALTWPAFNDAPLVGRRIAVTWTPSGTGNAVLAPQAQQPAGTTRLSDTSADVVTQAGGVFGAAVTDPATPNGQELGGVLDANSGLTVIENSAAASSQITIDFLRSLAPAQIVVTQLGVNNYHAGYIQAATITAKNADGVALTDVTIPVSLEQGEFIDLSDPYQNAAVGAQFGDWNTTGHTANVTLDDSGSATVAYTIERNAGFDDDGRVDDKLHAGTGAVNFEDDFQWTTRYTGGADVPLNQRATDPLVVELAPAAEQESSIINSEGKARANDQTVYYDVKTFDQFGNRTRQPISADDDLTFARGDVDAVTGYSNFDDGAPAVEAQGFTNDDQTVTVELEGAQNNRYNSVPDTSAFDPTAPTAGGFLTTSAADVQQTEAPIDWYLLDFATSTFTLNASKTNASVGTNILVTLKGTDQEGQVITGRSVEFVRSGPNGQSGDENKVTAFNANGVATYSFTGTAAGTALIDANVYDGPVVGLPNQTSGVLIGSRHVEVVFAGNPPTKIKAKLTGSGHKKGNDRLKVNAGPAAKGASASLYRKLKNGHLVFLTTKSLNGSGVATFTAKDKNGMRKTKYVVKIAATSKTTAATSNVKKFR